jgi:hypothetical protein
MAVLLVSLNDDNACRLQSPLLPMGSRRPPPVLSSLSILMLLTCVTDTTALHRCRLILRTIRLFSTACCLHRRVTMFITPLASVRTVVPVLLQLVAICQVFKIQQEALVKSVNSSHQTYKTSSTSHAKNTTALQPNAF